MKLLVLRMIMGLIFGGLFFSIALKFYYHESLFLAISVTTLMIGMSVLGFMGFFFAGKEFLSFKWRKLS